MNYVNPYGIMYTQYIIDDKKGEILMFLVTWIEAEEINYRLVKEHELSNFLSANSITAIDNHLMVQELTI